MKTYIYTFILFLLCGVMSAVGYADVVPVTHVRLQGLKYVTRQEILNHGVIVKDGKMYKIKEEIKEKYKISGITIFDKKAYTINKTLHPNVSKDTTRHGYKICTGRFDATFLSIEDIINMLKTINLDSAYRDIEESLSDIAVETERKETVWSDSW